MSGFSADIAEKSRVKEDAEMAGTLALALAPELALLDGVELLPHAVMARATPAASAIHAVPFLAPCKITTSLMVATGPARLPACRWAGAAEEELSV